MDTLRSTPTTLSKVSLILIVAMLMSAAPAEGLKFEAWKLEDGRNILLVRDCGTPGFEDKDCTEQTSQFARGDADRLRKVINRRFDEIWLISGGGNLLEGLEVGKVLREYQAIVRVPRGYSCVSACTVAFMGGFFRIVDEGATYEVHAASSFLRLKGEYQQGILKRLAWSPKEEYARFASAELQSGREWAARLLIYFQESLSMPSPGRVSNDRRLQRWLEAAPLSSYPGSARSEEDAERFRREGVPSAQDTLMRIERDSMNQAIAELRLLVPELGPRAGPALRMLEAMYSSRITLTAALSRETLIEMGYVTLFIDTSRR